MVSIITRALEIKEYTLEASYNIVESFNNILSNVIVSVTQVSGWAHPLTAHSQGGKFETNGVAFSPKNVASSEPFSHKYEGNDKRKVTFFIENKTP